MCAVFGTLVVGLEYGLGQFVHVEMDCWHEGEAAPEEDGVAGRGGVENWDPFSEKRKNAYLNEVPLCRRNISLCSNQRRNVQRESSGSGEWVQWTSAKLSR